MKRFERCTEEFEDGVVPVLPAPCQALVLSLQLFGFQSHEFAGILVQHEPATLATCCHYDYDYHHRYYY